MSDQNTGKKMVEEEDLRLFLQAYEQVTGESLALKCLNESPDSICLRPTGEEVGVELTRVTRSPDDEFHDRVILRKDQQDAEEALELVYHSLEVKDDKRAKRYGAFRERTILVLQLFDCQFGALLPYIGDDLQGDFQENGFLEIWLADYTGVEAYRDIELFGLKPLRWWGHHERPNAGGKPFA